MPLSAPLKFFVSGLTHRCEVGGADGIRTHDLLDAIEARSQLRHGPTEGTTKVYHSVPKRVLLGH